MSTYQCSVCFSKSLKIPSEQNCAAYHFPHRKILYHSPMKISGNLNRNFWSNGNRPLFPFGTERRKFPYQVLNFPVPVSHQPKTITGNRIVNGKRHLVQLFNGHPNWFTLTNGKHPIWTNFPTSFLGSLSLVVGC